MLKLKKFSIALALYVLLLIFANYCYMRFGRISVVFYDSLMACIASCFLMAIMLAKLKIFQIFHLFEKNLIIVIFLLLGYSYALSVPTVIDRSLTFYLLESLSEAPDGISLNQMKDELTKNYIEEYKLVPTRINEQLVSGTIRIDKDGCVMLTHKGMLIATLSKFYRTEFLPMHNLVFDGVDSNLSMQPHNKYLKYKCQ